MNPVRFCWSVLCAVPRWIAANALFCGSVALTGFLVWLAFLQRYGWPAGHEPRQLDHLFWAFVIVAGLLAIILASTLKVNFDVEGPGGFKARVDADGDGKNDTGQGA
jgi:hypothetical protein